MVVTGMPVGTLPEYLPYNQWNHGFAMVYINPDQTFEVENLTIVEGAVR